VINDHPSLIADAFVLPDAPLRYHEERLDEVMDCRSVQP